MDGTRWIPNGWQLQVENMSDEELHRKHLAAMNKFVMQPDWPKIKKDDSLWRVVDKLGTEMRTRMAAE